MAAKRAQIPAWDKHRRRPPIGSAPRRKDSEVSLSDEVPDDEPSGAESVEQSRSIERSPPNSPTSPAGAAGHADPDAPTSPLPHRRKGQKQRLSRQPPDYGHEPERNTQHMTNSGHHSGSRKRPCRSRSRARHRHRTSGASASAAGNRDHRAPKGPKPPAGPPPEAMRQSVKLHANAEAMPQQRYVAPVGGHPNQGDASVPPPPSTPPEDHLSAALGFKRSLDILEKEAATLPSCIPQMKALVVTHILILRQQFDLVD